MKIEDIKPANGYCLVEPLDDKIKGGLFVAEKEEGQKRAKRGKVLAVAETNVGDNGADRPIPCKAGDEVFFGAYSGEDVTIDEKEYRLIELMFIRGTIK